MVSESESYNRYDLGPDKAKTVQLFKGETLLRSLSMGKAAPSLGHTFVTLSGDKKIYHAKGNFTTQFTTDSEHFIDKTVFSLIPSEVTGLSIKKGETLKTLTRAAASAAEGDTVWKDENGTVIHSDKVNQLIASASHLACDKWLPEKTDGATPGLSLILTTDRPYTLDLFGESPMQGSATGKGLSFALSMDTSTALSSGITDILSEPAPDRAMGATD
jgi:hypothetical protein